MKRGIWKVLLNIFWREEDEVAIDKIKNVQSTTFHLRPTYLDALISNEIAFPFRFFIFVCFN